jgi:hypothetical protein
MRLLRGAPLAAMLLAGLVPLASATAAASETWSLTPTSVTMVAGEPQKLTFSATNLTAPGHLVIGCVSLTMPNVFDVASLAIEAPLDGSWSLSRQGSNLRVQATSDAARLTPGATVRFSATVTPTAAGTHNFTATAFQKTSCSAPGFGGAAQVAVTVAAPAPTVSAVPSPTPTQRPVPSSAPTATTGATPSPRPSAGPTQLPPTRATPSPTAEAAASDPRGPDPSPTSEEVQMTLAQPRDAGGAGEVVVDTNGLGMSAIVWSVPGIALGVPGLLVILWVAAQGTSGLIFLPWVRRLRRSESTALR